MRSLRVGFIALAFLHTTCLYGASSLFLKIPYAVYGVSMGEVGTAVESEFSSMYYNPATLWAPPLGFFSGYTYYYQGMPMGLLGSVVPIGDDAGVVGFAGMYLASGNIVSLDEHGDTIGSYGCDFWMVDLAYSYPLHRINVAVGFNVKAYGENLDQSSYYGVNFGIGALYRLILDGAVFQQCNFGLSIRDFVGLVGVRLGASAVLSDLPLLCACDVGYQYTSGVVGGVGFDYAPVPVLHLMVGYSFKRSAEVLDGLRAGFRVEKEGVQLEYGMGFNTDLGIVHRVQLGWVSHREE